MRITALVAILLSLAIIGCGQRNPGVPNPTDVLQHIDEIDTPSELDMISNLELRYGDSILVDIIAQTPQFDAIFFIVSIETATGTIDLRTGYFFINGEWIYFCEEIK